MEPWELDFTFGDRIRKARRVLGLTVEQYQARSRGATEDAHLARESCFGLLFISTPAALVTGVVLLLLFVWILAKEYNYAKR